MDCGIKKAEYWDMTIAELIRAIESYNRVFKERERQRAGFDYLLADTIGKSIARIYSSSNTMPKLNEVYPSLFTSDEVSEQEQIKKDELSALRFKQFANAYNSRLKGAAKK